MAIVRPAIAGKPTAYWSERLQQADIMHERLNSFREFLSHPQAEGVVSWLEPGGIAGPVPVPCIAGIAPFTAGSKRAMAPRLGQHTAEVLAEHGFSDGEIASLTTGNIVAQA
jgi:crotonobetainyl-CoA:carnitine CoA-transferase CaiB-like acyl-CoA transferase